MSDAGGLFDGVLAAGPVAALVGDDVWVAAMLAFEGALAEASADAGVVPRAHADVIAAVCARLRGDPAARLDAGALGRDAVSIGNPAGPLVRALTAAVEGEHRDAAASVHVGATSQDVVDTAAMVVARDAAAAVLADVRATAAVLATVAREHVRTPQAGRTLLQHATPTTFGLTAAQWLAGLDRAAHVLADARARLAAQLGGAAGTLAVFGERGPAVVAGVARRLDLAEPVAPWHTERSRVTELAAALAQVCAAVATVAGDVVLLAQTEVGEVASGSGGSSTMPHKHNPVEAVAALACARQAPGLAATLLATAGGHEHQRAAGSWHAEWAPLRDLLVHTGSAAWWLRACVVSLRPDPARMRENLDRTGAAVLVESVSVELARSLGRTAAHDAIAAAVARVAEPRPGDPAAQQPAARQPAAQQPAARQPAAQQPAARQLAAQQPAARQPAPGRRDPAALVERSHGDLAARDLVAVLADDPVIGAALRRERIAELLDPARHMDAAAALVARILDARQGSDPTGE